MKIALSDALSRLPLPATARWPEGVWDIEAFAHGTMSIVLFAPRGADHQASHDQDELYVVVRGHGTLVVDGTPCHFQAADVLFVPARTEHRFSAFSDDLVTWAIFWGAAGGESAPAAAR